jgi:hypothetical protein
MLWQHVNLCACVRCVQITVQAGTDSTHRTQINMQINIDYVHADNHSRTMFVVFSQVLDSSLRMVPVWTETCRSECHNCNFNYFIIWDFILLSVSVGTIKSFSTIDARYSYEDLQLMLLKWLHQEVNEDFLQKCLQLCVRYILKWGDDINTVIGDGRWLLMYPCM